MSQSPWLWVHVPWSPPARGAGTGLGKGAEMLSHVYRGLGALLLRILWCRVCLGHIRDGHEVLHPQGARTVGLGAAFQSWQCPSSCAMALVAASAHGLTLALFFLHQPQGPGHQPAWDCAQCQDAAVRVALAWHRGGPRATESTQAKP